ncbi:NIPSNAP family protein [Roseomonas sp. NAR14]|uniref:NIPSNAP family protein n=1 Tax=Roseomonas acroporae TaxID=2937791 RepID=A0A9X2BTZ4_9PROT|nr:NIPSNAP family protein [Roseomonas acroporae]MCK8784857.1 NIPSNAP family protein [Roseomonas acroporae]
MQRYAVTTISLKVGAQPAALKALERTAAGATGEFLACWFSEIGPLNQIMLIHGFNSDAELQMERERRLVSGDAFGIAEHTTGTTTDTYVPFPEMKPIVPGEHGPVFEARIYTIKPDRLPQILETWAPKLPGRVAVSPNLAVMYATDGVTPRFMHVWPYSSLNDRAAIRAKTVAEGIWPPPHGPDNLAVMTSTIYLPAPFSPVR